MYTGTAVALALLDESSLRRTSQRTADLRGAAREAGVLRELDVADGDGRFSAGLLAGEPEVDEKRRGLAIVAGKVAQQRVEDVVVDRDLFASALYR